MGVGERDDRETSRRVSEGMEDGAEPSRTGCAPWPRARCSLVIRVIPYAS